MSTTASIPIDKSWLMRLGLLDLIHGKSDHAVKVLDQQPRLSDDLVALKGALVDWDKSQLIDVGESGTLLRFLKFTTWKQGRHVSFTRHGTLQHREVCDDPSIIDLPLANLLQLDGGTSQWASAAVLNGHDEVISNPPFKLKLTYEAVEHWNKTKGQWQVRQDETIARQAGAFLAMMKGNKPQFEPHQAEDYCFARAFGLMTAEEGERRWPALRNHESDRIAEMEEMLARDAAGESVDSRDHRVVQALAMKQAVEGREIKITHSDAVNKSWPEFWSFLEQVDLG